MSTFSTKSSNHQTKDERITQSRLLKIEINPSLVPCEDGALTQQELIVASHARNWFG